jgi:hypothetical protein
MAESKRLKVFLCHAHSDAAAVRDLFRYLRREGVDVWLDKESLLPGADWEFEIRKAVRASDVVVVCLSKQFNQAGFRQKEVRIALDTALEKPEGEIFIIPARLEECESLPSLEKWHWVDLFEEGGRQKLIHALRARADQIGARLRRRGRYGKPIEAPPKGDEADELPEEAQFVKDLLALAPEGKASAELPLSDDELSSWLSKGEAQPAAIDARSGIWVDEQRNVWRDGKELGALTHEFDYEVLKYLIENKGRWVSYASIHVRLFGKVSNPPVGTTPSLHRAINTIRRLIGDDDKNPKLLLTSRVGHKLDW